MATPRGDDVVHHIREVFGPLKLPGADALVLDVKEDECAELLEDFGPRHWTEIPVSVLMRNRAGLFWLSAEGYRFYLPAFMTASLIATKDEGSSDLADYTVASLAPRSAKPDLQRDYERRISLLSDDEKQVIREFLEALVARWPGWGKEPAAAAWLKPEASPDLWATANELDLERHRAYEALRSAKAQGAAPELVEELLQDFVRVQRAHVDEVQRVARLEAFKSE